MKRFIADVTSAVDKFKEQRKQIETYVTADSQTEQDSAKSELKDYPY